MKTCGEGRAQCASCLHCSHPSGSEEKWCFYIHPRPCVNKAKRSSARVNGPPFHAAKERDSRVKYSYRNPASLRWHLDSLTQTLQVITRVNDFEEFARFSRVLRSHRARTACLDPGAIPLCPTVKATRGACLGILQPRWDATVPGCPPGLWGSSPGAGTTDIMSKKGEKKYIYM